MEEKRSVKVALLGLGTVGGGVYKLLERQKEELIDKAGASLELVKILVHNMKKERTGVDASLLTDKWEEIIEDSFSERQTGLEPATPTLSRSYSTN